MASLDNLSWLDWTALSLVAVALVLGLFRGFLWQASRFLSLVLAVWLASSFSEPVATILTAKLSGLGDTSGYYLSFVLILVGTILVASIVTKMLEGVVRSVGLGFYDHVGGAVLGAASASAGIIAALGALYHVMPASPIAAAARASQTHAVSHYVVTHIGLPADIQKLYAEGKRFEGAQDPGAQERAPASEDRRTGDSEGSLVPEIRAQRKRLEKLARRRDV